MKVILQILVLLLLGGILIFLFYNAFLSLKPVPLNSIKKIVPEPDSIKETSPVLKPQSNPAKAETASANNYQDKKEIDKLPDEIKPETLEPAETTIPSPKTTYQINQDLCIGCKLCIRYCPEGAISLKNGNAVIDTTKCTACGICSDGNNKNFTGCPVGAVFSRKF